MMNPLRTLCTSCRAAGCLAVLACMMMTGLSVAQPQRDAAITVLAAHPVVASLADTLVQETRIKVVRAAPASLPSTRWNAYLAGRGAAALARDAARADAALTLRSLWSDDPLYTLARRSNIRIVEIDAARPVDGVLPGIALQAASDRAASPLTAQPWLDPSNLGRMADIVAADLQRLAPGASDTLGRHLAAFKQRLVALSAESERALAQAPNLTVIVLSDRLDYLATALNLDAVPFQRQGDEWDALAVETLVATIRDNDAAAVLHHEALPDAVQHAIQTAKPDAALLALEPAATTSDVEKTLKRVVRALTTSQSASPCPACGASWNTSMPAPSPGR